MGGWLRNRNCDRRICSGLLNTAAPRPSWTQPSFNRNREFKHHPLVVGSPVGRSAKKLARPQKQRARGINRKGSPLKVSVRTISQRTEVVKHGFPTPAVHRKGSPAPRSLTCIYILPTAFSYAIGCMVRKVHRQSARRRVAIHPIKVVHASAVAASRLQRQFKHAPASLILSTDTAPAFRKSPIEVSLRVEANNGNRAARA